MIDSIEYELNGTEAYVTDYTGHPVNVVIPETITTDGTTFMVTEVKVGAFRNCETLTSLQADYIKRMETEYGEGAFTDCGNLKSVSIKNIRDLGWGSFEKCSSLVKVNLGNHPVYIGRYAFEACTSLKYIVIPAGSTFSSDIYPFSDCSMLQSIIYRGKNLGKGGSNANTYSATDLVTWSGNSFTYTGEAPRPSYTMLRQLDSK